jgi:hypothetical protein
MAPATSPWSATVAIEKVDREQRVVFGWLYVCRKANGEQVVDHSGETVEIDDLERATYGFNLDARKAGEMHTRKGGSVVGVGRLVESVCFTPEKKRAMGIPDGILPDGTWVGFKIDNGDAWEGVKSGRYKMLSLGGKALKRALERPTEG